MAAVQAKIIDDADGVGETWNGCWSVKVLGEVACVVSIARVSIVANVARSAVGS